MDGHGRLLTKNFDYIGEFKHGEKHGLGFFRFLEGRVRNLIDPGKLERYLKIADTTDMQRLQGMESANAIEQEFVLDSIAVVEACEFSTHKKAKTAMD